MTHVHVFDGDTFEWDERKAASNLIKHGVSFERACEVFSDPMVVMCDASPDDAVRDAVIGYDLTDNLLFVVFVERTDDAIRIISARIATKKERLEYEYQ